MFFSVSVPDPVVDKPPEADAWYKSALEKARQIAQSMKEGGPPPAQPDNHDAVANPIKTEPEVKPIKVEQESEKDEYGNNSTVNSAPSSSSASVPTPSVPATSMTYFSLSSWNVFTKQESKSEVSNPRAQITIFYY